MRSEGTAAAIVDELRAAGFSRNDISVLFPETPGARGFAREQSTRAPEGAATGVVAGGVLGGALGWLAGVGALAIPGMGPFVAAGPSMGALGGAAVGAATGGIAGSLIGLGMPELEARRYESKIRAGSILISVHTESPDRHARAKDILVHHGGESITTAREGGVPRARAAGR